MESTHIALFDLADQRLRWLGARQGILARNVANADTPKWQAQDIRPFAEVLAANTNASAGAPLRTNPMHLQGTISGDGGAKLLNGERAPDGNQVSLDRELEKIAQTDTENETVTTVYRKYLGMIRTALGR